MRGDVSVNPVTLSINYANERALLVYHTTVSTNYANDFNKG